MVPAKSAKNWMERLQKDLVKAYDGDRLISQLYAELPPIEEWDKITSELDKIAKDNSSLDKFANRTGRNHTFSTTSIRAHLLLFNALLKEDGQDHEKAFRNLLQEKRNAGNMYFGSNNGPLSKLLLLSKNHEKSIAWYQKMFPKNSKGSSSYHDFEKSAWELALAENRIDEGIKLLLAGIEKVKPEDKPSLISDLAR